MSNKKCKSHFPIMEKWKVIERTHDYTVWQCSKCKEVYKGKRRKGKIIKLRHRQQADQHKKELLQPFLDEKRPNPEFAQAYQNDPKVNLRTFYKDKELDKMVGKKYKKSHEPNTPIKSDQHKSKLDTETIPEP